MKDKKVIKYPNNEIMQNIKIMKYILFKDSFTVYVTCVICVIQVLIFIVHKFSDTPRSECLVHMGLKV